MKNRTIEFTAERRISYLPIIETICAFSEAIVINGEVTKSFEGLAEIEDIESVSDSEEIQTVDNYYMMFKKEVMEQFRTTDPQKVFNEADDNGALIKKPFSYVSENGIDDVVLLNLSYHIDGKINDVYGTPIPLMVSFNYLSGRVNNSHYNLEEILAILRNRNDVEIVGNEIQRIPYYNATEDEHSHIEFKWFPSDEDYKLVSHIKTSIDLREKIITDIFKFPKRKNADNWW